jgi:hypothetical protein
LPSFSGATARNGRGANDRTTSANSNGIRFGSLPNPDAIRGMYRSLVHPFRLPPMYFAKLQNPQLNTTAFSRSSNAAVNMALCPPSEWPMTPIRSPSTSGSDCSRSTARMLFQIAFMLPDAKPDFWKSNGYSPKLG